MLKYTMVACCLAGVAGLAAAGETATTTEGVRVFTLGDLRVTALSDVHAVRPADAAQLGLFVTDQPDALAAMAPKDGFDNSVNVFMVDVNDRRVLIDTGIGAANGGNLMARLAALDVAPDSITDVLLTHAHGDHIGGLVADGKPVFPNATVYISQPEYDYWHDDESRDALPEPKRAVFDRVRVTLVLLKDRLHRLAWEPMPLDGPVDLRDFPGLGGHGVARGVLRFEYLGLPGHTPGHTAFMFGTEKTGLIFWGDTMHRVEIQASHPGVAMTYDIDPGRARDARRDVLKLFDVMVEHGVNPPPLVAGAHLPFPGVGRFLPAADGDGYVYVPAVPDAK